MYSWNFLCRWKIPLTITRYPTMHLVLFLLVLFPCVVVKFGCKVSVVKQSVDFSCIFLFCSDLLRYFDVSINCPLNPPLIPLQHFTSTVYISLYLQTILCIKYLSWLWKISHDALFGWAIGKLISPFGTFSIFDVPELGRSFYFLFLFLVFLWFCTCVNLEPSMARMLMRIFHVINYYHWMRIVHNVSEHLNLFYKYIKWTVIVECSAIFCSHSNEIQSWK